MNLFVYGTLLFPEIRFALLSKAINYQKAILTGYMVSKFYFNKEEMEYPTLNAVPGKQVHGLLLDKLDESDLELLKQYEGDNYTMQRVEVSVTNSTIKANVFLHKFPEQIKFGATWDKNLFSKNFLKEYVNIHIPRLLSEINYQPNK